MSLQVNITVNDTATPVLARLKQRVGNREALHGYIAAAAEEGTRMHIRNAAKSRHTTSERLGAAPTNYLAKRAELVESKSDMVGVVLTVTGAIFRRVFGPVVVKAKAGKMLTIPWHKEAYGKRAGEFGDDLFVYRSKRGLAFLCKKDGRNLKFLFLLKAQVTLTQDKGLLPTEKQYAEAAELGARSYLRKVLKDEGMDA